MQAIHPDPDPWAVLTDRDREVIRAALIRAWEVWEDWTSPNYPDQVAQARELAKEAIALAERLGVKSSRTESR